MWVFVYPYIHVYTSKKMILANSINSEPGYEMPRTWVSHLDLETFNSSMLHFWCHLESGSKSAFFTGFSSCVYWQNIYFKECSVWSQTICPSTWTPTGLWGCHLLSQSLPSSPSNRFDTNLSSSKLRQISCSLSDVICREQNVPFTFQQNFV